MRTVVNSFRRQKPLVRALIAITVASGIALFVLGIAVDHGRMRESGLALAVVLPCIGLLEDRIYCKSRERYLETRAAAEAATRPTPPLSGRLRPPTR